MDSREMFSKHEIQSTDREQIRYVLSKEGMCTSTGHGKAGKGRWRNTQPVDRARAQRRALLQSPTEITTSVQAREQTQKQRKQTTSPPLSWFFQIVRVHLPYATWVSSVAEYPDHVHSHHRDFSDTLETLGEEFAWEDGTRRVAKGLA